MLEAFELFQEVCLDSVIDTAKLIPFLLVTYLAMEALEHGAGNRIYEAISRGGKTGPFIGALLGAIPQCGFSAMTATLYSGGVVTLGTLIAVILSTSDEMVPVFLAHPGGAQQMFWIIGLKVLVGLLFGYLVDLVVHTFFHVVPAHHIHDLCEREGCDCDEELGEAHEHAIHAHMDGHEDCCGVEQVHEHDHAGHAHVHSHSHAEGGSMLSGIARSAIYHTVHVSGFILIASFLFGLLIEGVGEEAVASFIGNNPTTAVFLTGLFGLIPNCAASVFISELYLEGVLAVPAMLAGLLVSGGTGLLVLFRTNDNLRENLSIAGLSYVIGVGVGLIALAVGM